MHPERRPDQALESLEARLRALPPPPVPFELEARLLATIPASMPIARRRWPVWAGVAAALAAACIVVVWAWTQSNHIIQVPGPPPSELAHWVAPQPPDDSADVPQWLKLRQDMDETNSPTFSWPLEERPPLRVSISIPPDLFD